MPITIQVQELQVVKTSEQLTRERKQRYQANHKQQILELARERNRRYRASHKQQLHDYYVKNITKRLSQSNEINKRRRLDNRLSKAIRCNYLGCDKLLLTKQALKIHLHIEHSINKILNCKRCNLVITGMIPIKPRIISNVIVKKRKRISFLKFKSEQKPKEKKIKRTKFDKLLQKLQQGIDRQIGIRVHIKYPDSDGYTNEGKFMFKKPFSQWVKLVNNPPDIPLKVTFNVALITAIYLFKEEYKVDVKG